MAKMWQIETLYFPDGLYVLTSAIVSQKHSLRCTCKLKRGMKADFCTHNLLYLIKCNAPIRARLASPISTVPFPVLCTDFRHLSAVLVCIHIKVGSTSKKKIAINMIFPVPCCYEQLLPELFAGSPSPPVQQLITAESSLLDLAIASCKALLLVSGSPH